jgi:hypothetical protein
VLLGWYFLETLRRSQEAFIRFKYGNLLMDVYDRGFEAVASVIDVTNIDDLAKLAERQNTLILHMARESVDYYLVQSDAGTYRYTCSKVGLAHGEKP